MKKTSSRRDFLKAATLTGVGFHLAAGTQPKLSASVNEQITVAGIGVGGKGWSDIVNASHWGRVVAVCDVDRGRVNHAQNHFEGSQAYTDYRELFDEMEKNIDAVTVSTTDHTHTPISLAAMQRGIHVYAQKPLTRTVYEARRMGETAKKTGVCTQMGNQGSAETSLRRAAMLLKAGAIGNVREIHVWTNRPIWPQGIDRPKQGDFSKEDIERGLENVDWDSWIGPAPMREFLPGVYHDFKWRGWWDFGTGALGDIGCHSLNMAFVGLNLTNAGKIVAETTGHNFDSFPESSRVTWEFPEQEGRASLVFKWYDGGWKPDAELLQDHGINPEDIGGSLILGDQGYMVGNRVVNGKEIENLEVPAAPQSEHGTDAAHSLEWGNAIRSGKPESCWSNFPNVAGPLAEMILAGNLAVWTANKPGDEGETIEWDPKTLKITNTVQTPGLDELITPVYRKGYDI